MDSILTSIKKLIGLTDLDTSFDTDIIIHVNSVFMVLRQLGVGPTEGFYISDNTAIWSDFMSDDESTCNLIKTYIYLKVRLIFDPPTSSALSDAINKTINEYEWRLHVEKDINATT